MEVSQSDSTTAHAARAQVPQITPAEGLIPLREAILRSESTDSDSSNDETLNSGKKQSDDQASVSSHSSAAVEGIRSKLVALAKEAVSHLRHHSRMI